jgi:tetratricopeptide (TPR) repeat protein
MTDGWYRFGLRHAGAALGALLMLSACAAPPAPTPVPGARLFRPAAASSESSAGAYLAGREAQGHHDLARASLFLTTALAMDPDNIELLQRTAVALAMQGRIPDAARLAGRLEAFDEDSVVPSMLLAEQRAKLRNWPGLITLLAGMPVRGLNAYLVPLCRAWANMGNGQVDPALAALNDLDHIQGLWVLRDFNRGLLNDLADRRAAAEQAYRATLASPAGKTMRTVSIIAGFYHRNGQEEQARELVDSFHNDHPDLPPILVSEQRLVDNATDGLAEGFFGASLTLRQANVPDLALFFSQLTLDLRPDFPLAQMMAGDILTNLEQFAAADDFYRALPATDPLYRAGQMRIARNLEDQKDINDAVLLLNRLAEDPVLTADAELALGDLWRRQRRWLDAVHAYDKAMAALKGDALKEWPLYYARGVALERANLWPRAEADLRHALELQPDEPQVLNYLGYSWIEQGVNLPRATAMIEKAVSLRPADGFIIDSLGWAFYRSGDYPRAVETLQRAVSLVPGDPAINDHLGDALWSAGRTEEARFQWQHALLSDPDPDLKAQLAVKLKQSGPPIAEGPDKRAE